MIILLSVQGGVAGAFLGSHRIMVFFKRSFSNRIG